MIFQVSILKAIYSYLIPWLVSVKKLMNRLEKSYLNFFSILFSFSEEITVI